MDGWRALEARVMGYGCIVSWTRSINVRGNGRGGGDMEGEVRPPKKRVEWSRGRLVIGLLFFFYFFFILHSSFFFFFCCIHPPYLHEDHYTVLCLYIINRQVAGHAAPSL